MILSWIILIVGIEIGMRTEFVSQVMNVISTNNLRFKCYFSAWMIAVLFHFVGLKPIFSWYVTILALILLTLYKFVLKIIRKSKVPMKTLTLLDLILLDLKSGKSLRRSIVTLSEEEKSWFKSFLLGLVRGFEVDIEITTESKWFNLCAREIVQVEKSRNRVIEQLEILRRYVQQEVYFRRKLKNATSGPRIQITVMSLLFGGLNVLGVRNLAFNQMKALFPISWLLFLLGLIVTTIMMRSFKWKV